MSNIIKKQKDNKIQKENIQLKAQVQKDEQIKKQLSSELQKDKKYKELTSDELKYLINLIGRSDFKGTELQILYSIAAKLQNQLKS